MNIIHRLTLNHLKENKKQTRVTLIGVMLSVTMITAVATSCVSFLDLLQRIAIENNGNWHVLYDDVKKEELPLLLEDENTKKAFVSVNLGHALIENGYNSAKPYFEVLAFNEPDLEAYPITLLDGRFPQNSNEILITKAVMSASDFDIQIGDTLTIAIGDRMNEDGQLIASSDRYNDYFPEQLINLTSYTFTVVGFVSQSDSPILMGPSYPLITALDDSLFKQVHDVKVAVQLHRLTPSLYAHATALVDESDVSFNRELLRYYGVTQHSDLNLILYALAGFFMLIIMVASVSVIYNAFSISTTRRTKYLGMLASIGATPAQKRSAILFEGFVIGMIAIPLGLLIGMGGIGVTFFFMNRLFESSVNLSFPLQLVISPTSIGIAILLSGLTLLISAYIPAYQASKISPMIAIRQTNDIKLNHSQVKTPQWIQSLFGIEGSLAFKNMKRQKRRYRATLFSLTLSVILFIVTSSFLNQLKTAYFFDIVTDSYDLSLVGDSKAYGFSFGDPSHTLLIDEILELDLVSDYNLTQQTFLEINLDRTEFTEPYQTYLESLEKNESPTPPTLTLIGVRDELFRMYVEDQSWLLSDEIPLLILNCLPTLTFGDLKPFDHLPSFKLTDSRFKAYNFNVLDLIEDYPMGVDSYFADDGIYALAPFSDIERVMNEMKNVGGSNLSLYLTSDDPLLLQNQILELYTEKGVYAPMIYNTAQEAQENEQLLTLVSIFSFGFITLITVISLVNMFNTTTTSILLRVREFSMIRSIGMEPSSFDKMIRFESLFYGLKALLYGIPLSLFLILVTHQLLRTQFVLSFMIPWDSIIIATIGVFIFVYLTMWYSLSQIKKINLIEALKQDNN